jgi:hypothetical protein
MVLDDQVLDHRIVNIKNFKVPDDSEKQMDIAGKLEKTFNIPRIALALLAIVFGIIVLLIPYVINIVVALFLIVWGLMEALRGTGKIAK